MNLHEYQVKQILADAGLPVSLGIVVESPQAGADAATTLGGSKWVVKAQVHAGGRGKGGGVKMATSKEQVKEIVQSFLGTRLVTYQTDAEGQPIHKVLIELCTDIEKELYLGAVVDRASRRVVFMASVAGGVNIEEVAMNTPEKIIKTAIDPITGALPFQGRDMGYQLGLNAEQIKQFTQLFLGLAKLFVEKDMALLEINPLVITKQGNLLCLDGKMNVDNNALFRQTRIHEMYDPTQEDPRERLAAKWELNYVPLTGNIGCMVNGAGLAMGTMDIIKLHGGDPANFLDVGGGATKERVSEAFKIILSDKKVKAVLVNIFGGIVRCDLIADGIIAAVQEVHVEVPVVVRLEGNNAKLGAEKLAQSGLNIIAAKGLDDAAEQVVQAAGVAA
jgi:succinyl-CoA synthetase beta subunit